MNIPRAAKRAAECSEPQANGTTVQAFCKRVNCKMQCRVWLAF